MSEEPMNEDAMNDDGHGAYRTAQDLSWDRLVDLFGQMLARFTVDPDGTAWLPMSDWHPTQVLAYEVGRRTEEPGTVQEMLLRRLADLTMVLVAAVGNPTDRLEFWTREWVVARGELMAFDAVASVPEVTPPDVDAVRRDRASIARNIAMPVAVPVVESWKPALVPNDPLADYVDVEGGYRWFYDGRPPEPVQG